MNRDTEQQGRTRDFPLKPVFRDLTPPLVWKLLRRAIARNKSGETHVPGFEQDSAYYDSKYAETKSYHRHYADSPYFFLWCVLVDRICPSQVQCLFDIGCGPGQFASFLRDRGLRKYVGLDFSSECIRMARQTCPSAKFVCDDVHMSDLFETLNYEVVVATEFLEHVDEDLAVITRIRSGTRVYASVPNFPNPAHVRHFRSAEDISARYGSMFRDLKVDEFLFGSTGMSLFLFEGVRIS